MEFVELISRVLIITALLFDYIIGPLCLWAISRWIWRSKELSVSIFFLIFCYISFVFFLLIESVFWLFGFWALNGLLQEHGIYIFRHSFILGDMEFGIYIWMLLLATIPHAAGLYIFYWRYHRRMKHLVTATV